MSPSPEKTCASIDHHSVAPLRLEERTYRQPFDSKVYAIGISSVRQANAEFRAEARDHRVTPRPDQLVMMIARQSGECVGCPRI